MTEKYLIRIWNKRRFKAMPFALFVIMMFLVYQTVKGFRYVFERIENWLSDRIDSINYKQGEINKRFSRILKRIRLENFKREEGVK